MGWRSSMKGVSKKRKAVDRVERAKLAARPLPSAQEEQGDSDSEPEGHTSEIDRLFAKVTRRGARKAAAELADQRAGVVEEPEEIPYYGVRAEDQDGEGDDEGDEGDVDEDAEEEDEEECVDEEDDEFSTWKAEVMTSVMGAGTVEELVASLATELRKAPRSVQSPLEARKASEVEAAPKRKRAKK